MTTNPVTEKLVAYVDAARASHTNHCPGRECFTCTHARGLAAQLATDLPDVDLKAIGEVFLHAIYALDAVVKDGINRGCSWRASVATAIWAACDAATSLYRSPTIPDGIDG